MKLFKMMYFFLCITFFASCSDKEKVESATAKNAAVIQQSELAKCLTQKGWTMYSSYTCAACIAQKKLFGEESFTYIKEVECNPHAPNTKVELCIEKKIRSTPTWLLEDEGQEIIRLEEYQLLEILAKHADCEFEVQ